MKKNIRFSSEHADLVRKNMDNFKSDVLKNLTQKIYAGGYQSVVKGFGEAFLQGGWKRSTN